MLLSMALACALGAGSPLDEGRRLFDALQYQAAANSLEKARHDRALDPKQRREVLELLGRAYTALGHREAAELAFSELLRDDPMAALPDDASPKVQDVFAAAKARVYPRGYVSLIERPAPAGALRLELVDPWQQVTELVVSERARDATAFTDHRFPARKQLDAALLETTVELKAAAVAADGRALAELAPRPVQSLAPQPPVAAVEPVVPPVAPPGVVDTAVEPSRPRWPGWALAAVAVACGGAATALHVLAAGDDRASRQRELSQPGYFAVDAQALNQRARAQALWGDVMIGAAALSAVLSVLVLVVF